MEGRVAVVMVRHSLAVQLDHRRLIGAVKLHQDPPASPILRDRQQLCIGTCPAAIEAGIPASRGLRVRIGFNGEIVWQVDSAGGGVPVSPEVAFQAFPHKIPGLVKIVSVHTDALLFVFCHPMKRG